MIVAVGRAIRSPFRGARVIDAPVKRSPRVLWISTFHAQGHPGDPIPPPRGSISPTPVGVDDDADPRQRPPTILSYQDRLISGGMDRARARTQPVRCRLSEKSGTGARNTVLLRLQ